MKAKNINWESIGERALLLKTSFPDLRVEITGSWIWVDGDTKPHRHELKEHGLRFSRTKCKWYLKGAPCARYGRRGANWGYIVDKYGIEEV
jgi:hypothetical protein